jgi:hypothetical protein
MALAAVPGCDRHTQAPHRAEPARCETVVAPAEAIAEATVARVFALVQRLIRGPAS